MKIKRAVLNIVLMFSPLWFCCCQQTPYHPLRIHNNITLDGKLNEPQWQQAEVDSGFMQYDPAAGAPPTEKSEIRMLYNDQYLYVGLRAFDHSPNQIVRYALQR